MDATYTKLRSGEWGIRVAGTASTGDTVSVHKRSGEISDATVGTVVWKGDDKYKPGQSCTVATMGAKPASSKKDGCDRCRYTESRNSEIWQPCDHCGTEPIYV